MTTPFISLSCPACGAKLQITADLDRFACQHCGTEHIVRRDGGAVSLKPVVDSINRLKIGVDRTASELAIKRLREEKADAIREVTKLRKKHKDLRQPLGSAALMVLTGLVFILIAAFSTDSSACAVLGVFLILAGGVALFGGVMVYRQQTADILRLDMEIKDKEMQIQKHKKVVDI